MKNLTAGLALTLITLFAVGQASRAEVVATPEELAEHFAEKGLVPLPGSESFLIESGVAGVIEGTPRQDEAKPYVLVVSGQPASRAALLHLAGAAMLGGREIQPLEETIERHVILAYLDDPAALESGVVPLDQVAASLDLSRANDIRGDCLVLRASGSSPVWPRLIEQTNIAVGMCLELEEAPALDAPGAAAIFGAEIPGLQFETRPPARNAEAGGFVGHVPSTFAALLAAKLSRLEDPPPFVRVDERPEAARRASRPYTGTIPAYTADVEGLLLEGVLPEGPAEAAGLEAGDVIVEIGGVAITDVYAYARVLDELEIDATVRVVFLRDGERRETALTPRARE